MAFWWLRDGDRLDFGGRELEVIYTPGEAVDHICLLARADRILFCGDILLHGPVWTHLEGGSLKDLRTSYRRLMGYFEEFDHLMPGHNQPWLDKALLKPWPELKRPCLEKLSSRTLSIPGTGA
jgi:glyoxylase-like metal-dependent hydrolase (beta-lactamase superfamily II)